MTEHAIEPVAPTGSPEAAAPSGPPSAAGGPNGGESQDGSACTQAQLRRFIKSRPYVPLHELRRRFGLNGNDDDVAPVVVDGHHLYVGLPPREATMLGELLGQGEVGYELLLDPSSPLIIGVYPMRPVQRP